MNKTQIHEYLPYKRVWLPRNSVQRPSGIRAKFVDDGLLQNESRNEEEGIIREQDHEFSNKGLTTVDGFPEARPGTFA